MFFNIIRLKLDAHGQHIVPICQRSLLNSKCDLEHDKLAVMGFKCDTPYYQSEHFYLLNMKIQPENCEL